MPQKQKKNTDKRRWAHIASRHSILHRLGAGLALGSILLHHAAFADCDNHAKLSANLSV